MNICVVLGAYYVSELSYGYWLSSKNSENIFKRKMALYNKARSMILFDRVMRGDLREIPK